MARMIWWTCRKCGVQWGETIVPVRDASIQEQGLPDAEHTTFCGQCLDEMTIGDLPGRAPKRKAVPCG